MNEFLFIIQVHGANCTGSSEENNEMKRQHENRIMAMPTASRTPVLLLLWWLIDNGIKCLAQDLESDNSTTDSVIEDRGIEEKVLGPFRIWHIIFIVILILITIIVVICCCHSFRVPRTRQEIEDNFQKRIINRDYLRLLERNPERVLKNKPAKISTTKSSRQVQPTKASTAGAGQDSHASHREPARPTRPAGRPHGPAGPARRGASDEPGSPVQPYKPVAAARAAKLGAATPLAFSPRDILALMSRRQDDGD